MNRDEAAEPIWRFLPAAAGAGLWFTLLAVVLSPTMWGGANARVSWLLQPVFHDGHVVRLGWEAWAQGRDPLSDPANPFNYPRLVLMAADWGALKIPVDVWGLVLAALSLTTLAGVLRARTRVEAIAYATLILSFPVMLLIERGNLDQVALVCAVVGCRLLARDDGSLTSLVAGSFALMAATLLKLYPLVILAGGTLYWRDKRRIWLGSGLALALFWVGGSLGEIALIMGKTGHGLEPSYGRALLVSRYHLEQLTGNLPDDKKQFGFLVLAAGLAGAAVIWGFLRRDRVSSALPDQVERIMCIAGALVYGGTYLLGLNWSYRLVFLLLCVPGLWAMARAGTERKWARGALACIVASLFSPIHLSWPLFVVLQSAQLALMMLLLGGASALVAAGSPGYPGAGSRPTS